MKFESKSDYIVVTFASGFGAGFSPFAPGTVGTAAAIPIYLLFSYMPLFYYIITLIPLYLFACWAAGRVEYLTNLHDPGVVVIDEILGYLIAMTAAPKSIYSVIAAFFIFRFFDILKVWPANWVENNMKGGWAVITDDVIAGIYSLAVMQVIFSLIL
jgi:phosphatidylglycerophosphatase A